MSHKSVLSYAFLLLGVLAFTPAHAAEDEFDTSGKLTGDWGGARTSLHNKGLDLDATEILESLGNVSGGTKRGGIVEGRLELDANLDLEKAFGLQGLTAFANAYQLHGNGLSHNDLGNLMTVSSIEADRGTRLFDMWVQQNLFDNNLSIRLGQLAADDEFITSDGAGLFVSSVWGWPSMMAANLPSGANAFPLATPGVRVQVGKGEPWTYKIAVFDGDPNGGGTTRDANPSGTRFNMNKGAFIMNEVDFSPKRESGLNGTYKLGAWYHTENTADGRYDNTGLSLANPGSTGQAESHHGNYGFYGVVDQALWRKPGTEDAGVSAFGRFMWAPDNRNTGAYQLDTGINVKGLVPNRTDDVFGVAFSYIRISDRLRSLDQDQNNFGTPTPIRDYESEIEVTYKAKVTPWLDLQPDFQYVMHPGGTIVNDTGTATADNAAIFGLRAIARF